MLIKKNWKEKRRKDILTRGEKKKKRRKYILARGEKKGSS